MQMTDAQTQAMERSRVELKQDKEIPLCINIHDGRLVPNVKNTRENPDYRLYRGDPQADLRTRMQSLTVGVGSGVRVIASRPIVDAATFDVSTASKDEMISFAFDEYALVLDASTHAATMRRQILAAAERVAAAKAADDMT